MNAIGRKTRENPGHIGHFALSGFPMALLLPILSHNVIPDEKRDPGKSPGNVNVHGEWYPLAKWQHGVAKEELARGNHAGANCGLLMGRSVGEHQFLFIDFDTEPGRDPAAPAAAAAREITAIAIKTLARFFGAAEGEPAPLWVRLTRPGRAGILVRIPASEAAGSKAIGVLSDAATGEGRGKIELLATGQQAVVGGIHPYDRGTAIRWAKTGGGGAFPAPKLDDGIPTVASREVLNAGLCAVYDALRDKGYAVTPKGSTSAHAGEPVPAEDRVPPSVDKLVETLDLMPHPADTSRDDYRTVMQCAAGCIEALRELDRLGDDGEARIRDAAIAFGARWGGVDKDGNPTSEDAEREKWEGDWAKNPANRIHCWDVIRGHAIRLGNEDLRAERDAERGERIRAAAFHEFEATEDLPPSGMPVPRRSGGSPWPVGFDMDLAGLWFRPKEGEAVRVSDAFEIVAETRNIDGGGWALALAFIDRDGRRRELALPRGLAHRDPRSLAERLEEGGLSCAPTRAAHGLLARAIAGARTPRRRWTLSRSGWHAPDGVPFFANPSGEAFGLDGDAIVLTAGADPAFARCGTLEGWQREIASVAIGNTRLAFTISLAFAGPLLQLASEPNGGVHLLGKSRRGKTSAAIAAASVWGDPGRLIRSWRGTANGIEAAAAKSGDALLILDEIGQADARDLGEVVYAIANGAGKLRALTSGDARRHRTWRNLLLSTGEHTLSERMAQAGQSAAAGQEVRLPSLPAVVGPNGIYEDLHGHESGAALSNHIARVAGRNHGVAAPAFVTRLAEERMLDGDALALRLVAARDGFVRDNLPNGADGQIQSVAGRFGLIAAAGELATEWGITGWSGGEATRAASSCLAAWLADRGTSGAAEDEKVVRAVRTFIEQFGESRFPPIEAALSDGDLDELAAAALGLKSSGRSEGQAGQTTSAGKRRATAKKDRAKEQSARDGETEKSDAPENDKGSITRSGWRANNRAGYRQTGDDGEVEFLFTPSGLAEACRPFGKRQAVAALVARELLRREDGSENAQVRARVDGVRQRFYAVRARILDEED